jgi:hypothetical protein
MPGNSGVHPEEKRAEMAATIERFRVADAWPMNQPMALFLLLAFPFRRPLLRAMVRLGAKGAERLACSVRTLPAIFRECGLERVDLLKMDVEGAELEAVEGLGDEGLSHVRQIAMECAPWSKAHVPPLMDRLRRVGFGHVALEGLVGKTRILEDPYPCMLYAVRA